MDNATDSRWPTEFLDRMRTRGDEDADRAVADVFRHKEQAEINRAFFRLAQTHGSVPDDFPKHFQTLFDDLGTLPTWCDPGQVALAERVFEAQGPGVVLGLFGASLPWCYAIPSTARALSITSGLTRFAERRLPETAQFVIDVMKPGGLAANGAGLLAARRVRLMHAALRHLLVRDESRLGWNQAEWGVPICQEDLGFVALTFSVAVVRGLRAIGVALQPREVEAVIHVWNCIAFVMGVDPRLIPANAAEAEALFDRIADLRAARTAEGVALTKVLCDYVAHIVPGDLFRSAPPVVVRQFVGDQLADLLGVPGETLVGKLESGVSGWISRNLGRLGSHSVLTREGMTGFASLIVKGLMFAERGGDRAPFAMPDSLQQEWTIN